MNRTSSAHEQLSIEWKEFQSAWKDLQTGWKDDVAVQFQTQFMTQFENEIPGLLSRLESLRNELKRAEREIHS